MQNPISKLVHELSKLPGVGERTALRLALYILRQPRDYADNLAGALRETVGNVRFCQRCFNLSLHDLCHICADARRDPELVCVVEDMADLQAVERTHAYRGHYHVLHGVLSPIDGIGPNELKISDFKKRLQGESPIREVILATNPDVNGDATALYLSQLIKPFHIKVTRLASGIPVGGHLEFIDQDTLSQALERRVEF